MPITSVGLEVPESVVIPARSGTSPDGPRDLPRPQIRERRCERLSVCAQDLELPSIPPRFILLDRHAELRRPIWRARDELAELGE